MPKLTLPLLLIFSIFLFFTCKDKDNSKCNEDLITAKGIDYYPLEIGKYITYELDSIIYSRIVCTCNENCTYPFRRDTSNTQLREEVVDVFEDNLGDKNFVIERYFRKDASEPWKIKDVWNTKITDTRVERAEENLRFIKMVFPVSNTVTWSGNNFFQDTSIVIGNEVVEFYQHWTSEYTYENIDQSEEINGIAFDSVMTVVQSNQTENKSHHRVATEKYARGVGMIFKEMLILDTNCCIDLSSDLGDCENLPWELKGEQGMILRQRIVDFN